jgi:hypothetical protein
MARIAVGAYMVRNPMGGNLSWALQWILGFRRLGHEVLIVEKWGNYPNPCYDLEQNTMSDDCTCGLRATHALLARFGLERRWCFVDPQGTYHGMTRQRVEEALGSADLFVDTGTWGTWHEEAAAIPLRVVVEGEPGSTQMKLENGWKVPAYDHWYSNGANIGTSASNAPAAGRTWGHVFSPVIVDLFPAESPNGAGAFTTVMNWQAHAPLEYRGVIYGQKDVEMMRFLKLPRLTAARLEMAVSGATVPRDLLREAGWQVRNGWEVTRSFDGFCGYIRASKGEFSVCKQVYVATHSGWFSDRSAAYLASGRPVVLQDTGFSAHLPCGEGLFAVNTPEEAAAAIEEIGAHYKRHSKRAREIARDYLDAPVVLGRFLSELGF